MALAAGADLEKALGMIFVSFDFSLLVIRCTRVQNARS